MTEHQFFVRGSRDCLLSLFIIVLVILAMSNSVNYQYPKYPFCTECLELAFVVELFAAHQLSKANWIATSGRVTA